MKRVVMVAALALAGAAFGWDIGHDTVATSVLARMPEKWRSRVTGDVLRDFHEAAKLPDGGDRPLGEWNHLYVRCIGRKLRALVNERYAVDFEKMIEATGSGEIRYRGPLAIESAGAPLSFRNVYLRDR